MAINFPDTPSVNDTFTVSGSVYVWSGVSWNAVNTVADVQSLIDNSVSGLVDSAPEALDTLNELAAALGDDASFATTVTSSLAAKAPLESPTFTGTVAGVTKTHVGLGNVDNTSDASKPVSTATQTALDLKANLTSPTFTGTVSFTGASVTGIEALPSQSGNSGRYLTTNGSSASWGQAWEDDQVVLAGQIFG